MTKDIKEISSWFTSGEDNTASKTKPSTDELIAQYLDKHTKAQSEQIIHEKRKLALASHLKTTTLNGYISAKASVLNPLHTELDLFITDFSPNRNKQGVKRSEATNIIRTAKNSPLKINFDGESVAGHANASVIGTITDVKDETDKITGVGIIWDMEFKEVAEYLKSTANIQTSWEIYYEDAEVSSGTSWLTGCVFAGLCIVSNPAYGEKARAHVRA